MSDSWNPNQYNKFKEERSLPFYDLLGLVQVKPGMDTIDLGCGTGELTAHMHSHLAAHSTLGIDSSASMLEKTKQLETPGLKFQEDDISSFNHIEKFDLILANASLQWCDHHPELFSRLVKALKPHGQLAVQMPVNQDYPTHTVARALGEEWMNEGLLPKTTVRSSLLKPEEYAELLFRLGFTSQNVFVKVYSHVLEDRNAVVEWVKGTLLTYYKSNLTDERYLQFFQEYKERLFKELPDNKPFFFPFKRILMWGTKP